MQHQSKIIPVSGTDPIGQFIVEGTALNPAFKLVGKGLLYGAGRLGSNYARAKLISGSLDKSLPKTTLSAGLIEPIITSRPSIKPTLNTYDINSKPIINTLTDHLKGNKAIQMFKEYGGVEMPQNSGLGQRINRYIPEVRERYGLVDNTNISDKDIANSLYKHINQMQKQTGSANVNSAGEPRILFRGDTRRYTSLKERISPNNLASDRGTMDNSLGNLFLGDYGRPIKGGGPERYLVGKDANIFSENGWAPRGSATGAKYIDGGIDLKHQKVWLNPDPNVSTHYGFLKAPAEATTSGVNDMNAFFVNTKSVRDATKEISVANDDFLAMQPTWKGGSVEANANPTRLQMAQHYNAVLNDARVKNQGLMRSSRNNQFRDEHYGADYFALPNFNISGAKHLLPYDLRIPRDFGNPNIYKTVAGGLSIGALDKLNRK